MNIEISSLSNGLMVITDPMTNLESAALGVWVGTGSRDELPAEMGISHMLEHMAFKGTSSRSARVVIANWVDETGERAALCTEARVEAIGAQGQVGVAAVGQRLGQLGHRPLGLAGEEGLVAHLDRDRLVQVGQLVVQHHRQRLQVAAGLLDERLGGYGVAV